MGTTSTTSSMINPREVAFRRSAAAQFPVVPVKGVDQVRCP